MMDPGERTAKLIMHAAGYTRDAPWYHLLVQPVITSCIIQAACCLPALYGCHITRSLLAHRIFLNIEDYLFYNQGRRPNQKFRAIMATLTGDKRCTARCD